MPCCGRFLGCNLPDFCHVLCVVSGRQLQAQSSSSMPWCISWHNMTPLRPGALRSSQPLLEGDPSQANSHFMTSNQAGRPLLVTTVMSLSGPQQLALSYDTSH